MHTGVLSNEVAESKAKFAGLPMIIVLYPKRVKILACFSLLMFLIFGQYGFAGNCDCAKDPLAKNGCGPKPVKMSDTTPFSKYACTIDHVSTTLPRSWFENLIKETNEDLDSNFSSKSKLDLINYLSCHRETDAQFCHFTKSLSPYVAYACEVTNFPLSVQSCLFMKESSFDPKAKSSDGALGYAQLMPETMKDLDKCFSSTPSEWTKKIAEVEKEISALKAGKLPKDNKNAALKMKETTLLIYRARRKVRELWESYWEGTKDGEPCRYGSKPVRGRENSCLKMEMATCYRYAPILSMLKQTLDANMIAASFLEEDYDGDPSNDKDSTKEVIRRKSDDRLIVNGMSDMDSALFLTGAYNYGAPGFAKKCGDKTTMKSCIESFPVTHETRKHLQGIRNCAQNGSGLPIQDPYNPKAIRKNCDQKRCF
ncbi:MAG: transglycosylase SLT domain-containing protein [Bdellovibrionales bacterium]|nr:transglycosylase SLT domain-containing protein [Bdellovibrionales bacterium]